MPVFNADILTRDPIRGGAVGPSGLTSLLGTNPAQLAAEEAAKAGASTFGLGTLMQGLGPLSLAYSVLDLFGFFDKSLQETPMTPEERAKFEAESRLALASSGLAEGGEGAYETLIDAIAQASDTEGVSEQDIADILGQSGYTANLAAGPFGPPSAQEPTVIETIQENINRTAREVGSAMDTVFDVMGLPKPDYAVLQPNMPGGTVVWGQPSGGVFGRIGTTPGGTVTGVQTGIPVVDVFIGKVADVISGRIGAGDVLNTQDIIDIVKEEAGLPDITDPGDIAKIVTDVVANAAQDEEAAKVGIDLLEGGVDIEGGVPEQIAGPTIETGGGDRDITNIETGGGGDRDITNIETGGGADRDITDIVTGGGGDRDITNIETGGRLSDEELDLVLETIGGPPAVPGGYDEIVTGGGDSEVTKTLITGGGGSGGGGGLGTPETIGLETIRVEPGPLVDIPGFYDISSMSIIPDYIDELVARERRRQTRGAAEGGHVKRFSNGDLVQTGSDGFTLNQNSVLAGGTGTGDGDSNVRRTLSQFVNDNAGALLASAVGGLFGLLDSGEQQPAGYQGGIPDYTAQRSLLPGAFDQTGRRPGSMGRRYFTDVQYVPTGEGAVMQGVGLPAVAPEADTSTELDTEALTATTPAATTPAATTPVTTPAVEDKDKLDISGDIGEIATTSVTPYGAIPVDQDYTQEERDIVAQAIASGEATIPQVAGRFDVTTGDVIEELLRGGYQTPADVVESLGYTGGVEGLIVELAAQGRTTPEEIVGYFGNNPEYPEYQGITTEDVSDYLRRAGVPGYAGGGMMQGRGYYLGGPTDGMADQIPATINNIEPARLSDGEFVIPADVVSHLGNGNSEAGAQQLYSMMDRVRTERTGTTKQGPMINPIRMMPA